MSIHKPVLLRETIELLNLKSGMTVVDVTLGGGGHSREVLKRIGDKGMLIAFDSDIDAIKNFAESSIINHQSSNNFQIPIFKYKNQIFVNDNFTRLKEVLEVLRIEKVDAVLADLGWSSDQLVGKGMSFSHDEKLDMRLLRNTKGADAKDIVNNYSERELGRIIHEYGEEKFWKNIARKIVECRSKKKIETTKELADIIAGAVPEKYKHLKLHPATRTFQAIRIEVNRELENLKKFLPQAMEALAPQGRLAVISFHSLEDRIVKNFFRENARGCICPPAMKLQKLQEELLLDPENENARNNLEQALRASSPDFPQCVCGQSPKILIITKKPLFASDEEIKNNPRARSAKLRVCEKI